MVWENLEEGEPLHMKDVNRERVLELWIMLSEGKIDEIQSLDWQPGYG